jgi:sugar lactone lactonase YvrE
MKVSGKRAGSGPVIAIDTDTKKILSVNNDGVVTQIVLNNNTMNSPAAIEIDTRGNIFIADKATHQILIAYTNGHVSPLTGVYKTPGFLNNAGSSTFTSPSGLVLGNSEGLLYISDTGNKAIRKVIFQ